jgi:hypothetical protein
VAVVTIPAPHTADRVLVIVQHLTHTRPARVHCRVRAAVERITRVHRPTLEGNLRQELGRPWADRVVLG